MGHPPELLDDGPIDLRHPVAQQVAPESRGGVEQAPPLVVDQAVPLGPLHHQRLALRVLRHLGEGMPEVIEVKAPDLLTAGAGPRARAPAGTASRHKRPTGSAQPNNASSPTP